MNAVGALVGEEQLGEELAAKYESLELLGRGGMGCVVLARHRQLGELFAIKLLARNVAASEPKLRFLREARAAASIRSRHVARVTDAAVLAKGQAYIVMEYLRGQDLARVLETQGALPVVDAVDYVLAALEAIAEAHSLGIVHRDLKPSNLFAAQEPGGDTTIKVLDFGLAKMLDAAASLDAKITESGGVLGTPSYMSPEQFAGAEDVDGRADVWGIGATLFELLTGKAPFRGMGIAQLYTAVMHQPIPRVRQFRTEVPEGLDRVIDSCLQRDRGRRPQSIASLARALAPYASETARQHVQRIGRVLSDAPECAEELPSGIQPAAISLESTPTPAPKTSKSAWRWFALLGVLAAIAGAAFEQRSYRTQTPKVEQRVAPPLPAPAPIERSASPAAPSPSAVESPRELEPRAPATPPKRRRVARVSPPAPPASLYERYP
ncbi:MAG TPA: serine/threonine-protein kinase [Polyangiales bacterium]|nr:serine/threonine-protein kinase [Polyangiales bacterium]